MKRKSLVSLVAGAALVAVLAIGATAVALDRGTSDDPRVRAAVSEALSSANLGEAQSAALADGRVTREELDSAIAEEVSCLRSRGINAEVVPGSGRNPSSVTVSLPSLAVAGDAEAHLGSCKDANSRALMGVWLEQNRPGDSEAAEARRFVAQCIEAREGTISTPDPSDADISQWLDSPDPVTRIAAGSCIEERYKVYGF